MRKATAVPLSVERTTVALLAIALLAVGFGGCGGGSDSGVADVFDAAPDIPGDVPAAPETVDAAPDLAPEIDEGCPEETVFVPSLDACYALTGDPAGECAPGDPYVLSFSTDGQFPEPPPDAPEPVVEWARFPATVTSMEQGKLAVTGSLPGNVPIVAQFAWSNFTRFGAPWTTGQAVEVEWIGVPNPFDPLIPDLARRHGLKVRDAVGRLLFMVDDGKGDLAEPIWTYAPAGQGMQGFSVTREAVGCPVAFELPGRDTPALPVALRVSWEDQEKLVQPGDSAQFRIDDTTYTFQNALSERRVGEPLVEDPSAVAERMAWLVVGRPQAAPGQPAALCNDDDRPCDAGLLCAEWPGGGRVCLPN